MTKRLTATENNTSYNVYIGKPRRLGHGVISISIHRDGVTTSIEMALIATAGIVIREIQSRWPDKLAMPDRLWCDIQHEVNNYFAKELKSYKKEKKNAATIL